MSRIFISHSSANNAEAIALRDWLVAEGWSDLFLDLDPDRGIAAGERWERALNEAARRCEAVIFLISKAWLASRWCTNELALARRLNKRLFGVLVEEGLTVADLPHDVTSTWQLVNLATGRDHRQFRVTLPVTGAEEHVTYSHEGLARLKAGLQRAGLHASYFNWPPATDPKRAPYRGLRPLEADDAGIFFGREAPIIEAIDRLRGLTEASPPRVMVVLGASGAGKSSFLRAGLLPRLGRDPQVFLPLPVVRPERAALSGETGLVKALSDGFEAVQLKIGRGDIREAVEAGADKLKPLLARLLEAARTPAIDGGPSPKPPTLVLAIDQSEELFLGDAQSEAKQFLVLLRDLVLTDAPAVIAIFAIRSDNYDMLQTASELDTIHKIPLDLGPMPKGSFAEVIKGPVERLKGTSRALKMSDALIDALLIDIEVGSSKDALPLLAFILERLYEEYGSTGHLTLEHYKKLGGVRGSIEAAVKRAFAAADGDPRIPHDPDARLDLLRRGLIPWLAGVDPETKAPRRRVARVSEIPAEARPLVELLIAQRLLSTDLTEAGEKTIEPAHEALLRQWAILQNWLHDDAADLLTLEKIRAEAKVWDERKRVDGWLSLRAEPLAMAERVAALPHLIKYLAEVDRDFLRLCRETEDKDLAERERLRQGAFAYEKVELKNSERQEFAKSEAVLDAVDRSTPSYGKIEHAIGGSGHGDWKLDPREHAHVLPDAAGPLRRILTSARVAMLVERYQFLNQRAIFCQRRHRRFGRIQGALAAGAVVLGLFAVAAFVLDWSSFNLYLQFKLSATQIAWISVLSLIVGASAVLTNILARHSWLDWRRGRAEAEGTRQAVFDEIVGADEMHRPGELPALPLQLEYFRRYGADVNRAYFAARGRLDNTKVVPFWLIAIVFGSLLCGFYALALPYGFGAVLHASARMPYATMCSVGAILVGLAALYRAPHDERSHAARYKIQLQNLDYLMSDGLEEARFHALNGNRPQVQTFVNMVHTVITADQAGWVPLAALSRDRRKARDRS